MGLFSKPAKVNPIKEALEDLMKVFSASNSPDHHSFDELNQHLNVLNLLRLSKDWRDRSSKEKAFGYAAVFSSIHWRTFVKSRIRYISGETQFHEELHSNGCANLDFLYTDLKNIQLGVREHGVSTEEYDDCKEFIALYKGLVADFVYEQEAITKRNGQVAVSDFGRITLVATSELIKKLESPFPL